MIGDAGAPLSLPDQKALEVELRGIVEAILASKINSQAELEAAKKGAASRLGLASLPSNADILSRATPGERSGWGCWSESPPAPSPVWQS